VFWLDGRRGRTAGKQEHLKLHGIGRETRTGIRRPHSGKKQFQKDLVRGQLPADIMRMILPAMTKNRPIVPNKWQRLGRPAPVLLAWLGLMISLVYLLWRLGSADPASLGIWISSDTLYPVNVTTDVIGDKYSFSGWRFSIAPCWFPDVFTTGVFWILTHNVIIATLLAGFIQLGLIVNAFGLARNAMAPQGESLQTVFLLGVSVWITLFVADHPGLNYPDLLRLFLPQSHVGSLVMSLYALALGLIWIRQAHQSPRVSKAVIISFATVSLLAGMSNLMFFPQILLPFTAAVCFVGFFNILGFQKCWAPVVIGWLAAIIGAILNRVLFHTTPISAQAQVSREAFFTSLDVFVRGATKQLLELQPLHLLALLWALACLGIVAMTLRKMALQGAASLVFSDRMLCLFCSGWFFSDLFSCGSVIVGGNTSLTLLKDYLSTTHYLQAVFFVPLFGLPLLVSWIVHQNSPARISYGVTLAGAFLVVFAPAFRLTSTPVPRTEISVYKPPLVKFLDDLATNDGLKYGLAGYWQSRIITLLSDKALRVYAVDGSLNPFLWVNNVEWYTEAQEDRKRRPPIDFVVLDDPVFKISRESVVRILGEPLHEVGFQNTRVLIYSTRTSGGGVHLRPTGFARIDEPLRQFSQEVSSPVKSVRANPGQTITIPVTIMNPSNEQWASNGKYPVHLSYKWFDSGRLLDIEGIRTMLPRPVNPGQGISFDARVEVPKYRNNLTLQLTLVQEGVAWFITRGATPLVIEVEIKPGVKTVPDGHRSSTGTGEAFFSGSASKVLANW
jgi:hypothetical protein